MPSDGNCELHAVINQLVYHNRAAADDYSIDWLRTKAVDYLENHPDILDKASLYISNDGTSKQYLKKIMHERHMVR